MAHDIKRDCDREFESIGKRIERLEKDHNHIKDEMAMVCKENEKRIQEQGDKLKGKVSQLELKIAQQ